jgi:hypothetical protein
VVRVRVSSLSSVRSVSGSSLVFFCFFIISIEKSKLLRDSVFAKKKNDF